jgi:hypothetical protein
MIPRVKPEGVLIRKPGPIPDRVEDKLFGIMRYAQNGHPVIGPQEAVW